MGSDTTIEWADKVWNPVVGCTRVSEGCRNCYAERMAKRLSAMADADEAAGRNPGRKAAYFGTVDPRTGRWTGQVNQVEDALTDPLRWRKPRRVFTCSMSDLFHHDVPFSYIDRVFGVMALTPRHTYQVLTKRPARMAEYLTGVSLPRLNGAVLSFRGHLNSAASRMPHGSPKLDDAGGWPLPNVWLGTSVENQQTADERIPHLLRCPAAVRFLSCEPLLGRVQLLDAVDPVHQSLLTDPLTGFQHDVDDDSLTPNDGYTDQRIHWVIVGGESGPNARPMHPDWVRSLRDQCQAAGVAYFFKQWGEWKQRPICRVKDADTLLTPDDVQHDWADFEAVALNRLVHEQRAACMFRVGKKAAGRELDGRTWDEFPQQESGVPQ